MTKDEPAHLSSAPRRLLPPRGLMLSLLAQIPAILSLWPLKPSASSALTGIAMLVVGLALNIWSERLFRRSGVGVCPFSAAPRVVTQGPYRFTRNPMYLGLVLVSASAPMMTGIYFNLWAAAALAAWLHFRFVLPEEDFLEKRLGMVYLVYASRNPRWLGIPGPKLRREALEAKEVG